MKITLAKPFVCSAIMATLWLSATGQLPAQPAEAPPAVEVLWQFQATTNDLRAVQSWNSPGYYRAGTGFVYSASFVLYHRDLGGTNVSRSTYHAAEGGTGDWNWDYRSDYLYQAQWSGPLPAMALLIASNYTRWAVNADPPVVGQDATSEWSTNYYWAPEGGRKASQTDAAGWTERNPPSEGYNGYYETWNNTVNMDTVLELFAGGPTNSSEDVTMQLSVSVYDNLRGRYLTWNEFTVLGLPPDTNGNVFLLMQDNQRTNLSFTFSPTNGLPANVPPGSYDFAFGAYPTRHHVLVGVDKNRDGSIDLDGTNDLSTAASPHVFWVNNDRDRLDTTLSDYFDESGPNDYAENVIHNARDLEDYERIAIRLPDFVFQNNENWQVEIESSAPIKLFYTITDSKVHVTDEAHAAAHLNHAWGIELPGSFLGECNPSTLLPSWWMWRVRTNGYSTVYLLFKGGGAASGPITAKLYQNGVLVGRGNKTHLQLLDISSMYDHFTAGDTTAQGVIPASTAQQIGTCQLTGPDDDYILFVHGWRMQEWERRRFAETAFKRLWWQGYKGRFGLFSWPTEWVSTWSVIGIPPALLLDQGNFNRSEQQAWKSGTALGKLLAYNLNAGQHAGKVRVFAHSMGNVVVGEALRQLAVGGWTNVVQTYVSCQGAVASHAYDAQATVRMLTRKNPSVPGGELFYVDDGTRNLYSEYPVAPGSPYFSVAGMGGVANFVNYRNHRDFALGNWEYNQSVKPDSGYQWSTGNDFFIGSKVLAYYANGNPYYQDVVTSNLLPIPDHFEIFSHAAEARCYSIGAQPWLAGPFSGEVDLNAPPYSFDDPSSHHSAQFNSSIQARWSFWYTLLTDMGFSVVP